MCNGAPGYDSDICPSVVLLKGIVYRAGMILKLI